MTKQNAHSTDHRPQRLRRGSYRSRLPSQRVLRPWNRPITRQSRQVKGLPVLKDYFAGGRIELVIVEDLIKGDFSQALRGVDAVS